MPYAFTITLSAFLIFQIQPMVGKYILPWFGGTPDVWSVTIMFFQIGLLVGYGYAHVLVRFFDNKKQILIHLSVLLLSMVILPITPDEKYKLNTVGEPHWQVVLLLFKSVGAPYILLAATSPLLQYWYAGQYEKKSPYRLYALSNVGSLVGLLSYPFIIEPFLKLNTQTLGWSGLYLLYFFLCAWTGHKNYQFQITKKPIAEKAELIPMRRKLLWLALSGCASLFLLACTQKITQSFIPLPFFMVILLSIYLMTFIISFENPKWYKRGFFGSLFVMAIPIMIYGLQYSYGMSMTSLVLIYTFGMFCVCMVCHGELARIKPPAENLTLFYLIIALGGALGGIFVSLVTPYLLNGLWELHIGIILAMLLMGVTYLSSVKFDIEVLKNSVIWCGCIVITIGFLGFNIRDIEERSIDSKRNFYGIIRVLDLDPSVNQNHLRMLHGNTSHGSQFFTINAPTTYYSRGSGVALALENHPKRLRNEKLNVGVVGLGVGTLAAYSTPKDYFRFYEINPIVIELANKHFKYLSNAKGKVDIIKGDGRINLENEIKKYGSLGLDVLVLDAFTGGSIPIHLLTKEALRTYFIHLNEGGILAFNISNFFFGLEKVLLSMVEEYNRNYVFIKTPGNRVMDIYESRWFLMTNNREFLNNSQIRKFKDSLTGNLEKVKWTDDYSSLLRVLK